MKKKENDEKGNPEITKPNDEIINENVRLDKKK